MACRREVLRESFAVSYAQEEKSRKKGECDPRSCPGDRNAYISTVTWFGCYTCMYIMYYFFHMGLRITLQVGQEEEKEDILQSGTFW